MADGDTQPQPPPDYTQQLLALAQQLQGNQQPVQPDQTPVSRGWLSLLGQGLGGGGGDVPLSPQQQETAGLRSLLGFGTSLMQSARYQPGATIFSRLGEGMEGAQRAMTSTEQLDAQQLAARQAYQQQQFQNHMEALKTAIPLLQSNITLQQLAAARAAASGNAPGALTTTASPGSLPIINRDPSIPVAGAQANNPGNIMAASGLPGQTGYIPLQGGRTLAAFPDLPTGYAAAAHNLITYQDVHGVNTVQDAVKRWVLGPNPDPKAPQPDLTSYTADISKALGVKPTDTVDFHDPKVLQGFLTAQVPHETGGKGGITVNPDDVTKGVQMALGGYKPPTGPPAATAAAPPPAASTATPAPPTAPRGAATLPTPPVPPEGMLPSPIGAPAAAPANTAGQPAGGAVVAGPPGAATVGAAKPPGPAVPGDVNAILRGMIARGANPATLLPGLPGAAAPGGAATQAAGPAVTGGASAAAVAQAQATNTPVPVPGGQGLWALPNGQVTSKPPTVGMPAAAPPTTPPPAAPAAAPVVPPPASQATPPPATAPAPFVPQRMPLPPDIQARIDHPQIDPSFQSALNVALAGGDIAKIGEARTAIGTATDAARNKAIADGEAWQTKSAELQAQQAAAAQTQQYALAQEAQKNKEVQVNTARDAERTGDKATLATYKTDADTAQGEINTLQILRNVEKNMPESGSVLLKQHPELLDTLSHMGLPREQADALGAMDLYQRMLGFLGTQLSQKAAAAGGTARQAEISSNMSVLPGLATDHAGRQQLTGFLLNLAQYRVNRAQAAEDYYYSSQHPDTSINPDKNLHTLIGFPQKFGADPSNAIIPQVPLTPAGTPDTTWAAAHVHPGMLAKFPQKVRDANNNPVLDANGKPTWQWSTGVQGDAP